MHFERAARKSLRCLAVLLQRHGADEPALAATAFLSLAVGSQTRRIVLGDLDDHPDRDAPTRYYVSLFLNGVQSR